MTARYEAGNVTVTAELQDTDLEEVTGFQDVVSKYEYLSGEMKEHLYALFLNGGNETLAEKLIGIGTSSSVDIDITDIVRTAVLINARAVILIHNHPSGQNNPTDGDIEATEEVRDALALFDISLLDHVIISRGENLSMRAQSDVELACET